MKRISRQWISGVRLLLVYLLLVSLALLQDTVSLAIGVYGYEEFSSSFTTPFRHPLVTHSTRPPNREPHTCVFKDEKKRLTLVLSVQNISKISQRKLNIVVSVISPCSFFFCMYGYKKDNEAQKSVYGGISSSKAQLPSLDKGFTKKKGYI